MSKAIAILLVFILILVVLMRSLSTKLLERFQSNSYVSEPDKKLFNGFWLYETAGGKVKDFIYIESGKGNFMTIRRRNIIKPDLSAGLPEQAREQNILTEYPLFRFIPLSESHIQIVSTNHTYVFEPTDIKYIETTKGPALIINGKTYYETRLTF